MKLPFLLTRALLTPSPITKQFLPNELRRSTTLGQLRVALARPRNSRIRGLSHGMTGVTTGLISTCRHPVIEIRLDDGRYTSMKRDELFFPNHPAGYNQESAHRNHSGI